jgi:hypothetical protein
VLEFFHPFKHIIESIWQEESFFRSFIAPFTHVFTPDSTVLWNSKLKLVRFFGFIFGLDGRRIYSDAFELATTSTKIP